MSIPGIAMMKRRREFLAARKGRRLNGPFFFIETRDRADGEPARLGLTVTKKLGNAVVRNRIKRRLREAVRLRAGEEMVTGYDYVVVARREILDLEFDRLAGELANRFSKAGRHAGDKTVTKRRPGGRPSGSD